MHTSAPSIPTLAALVALAFLAPAFGAEVSAPFDSAATVPVTAASYTATGKTVDLRLNFSPPVGTSLTVVNNTGLAFIQGAFGNLAHGQKVNLTFGGVAYAFVANYYGGTGNDLVLQSANVRLLAWGYNSKGQLGLNRTIASSREPAAVDMTGVLSGKTVIAMAAGQNHCIVLCSDGTLAGWGSNSHGQLGNNSSTQDGVFAPVLVNRTGVLAGKTVIAIAAGSTHSLALCTDGTLAAWGLNGTGQLGNNAISPINSMPVLVNRSGVLAGRSVVSIAAGNSHSLALCADGTVASWGANAVGQLGNNSTTLSRVPVLVTATGVLAGREVRIVAAGAYQSFAVCADGAIGSWGVNSSGQLGDNTTTGRNVPVLVNRAGVLADKLTSAISAGYSHTLVLCTDGTLAAWGGNLAGLGNNATKDALVPVLVSRTGVLADKTVTAIAAGFNDSYAVCADGTLASWGGNFHGGLGNNTTTASKVPVAVNRGDIGAGERPLSVVAGEHHALALVASPAAPLATTLAATEVSDTGGVLNGSVNPQGGNLSMAFEYGPTPAYGMTISGTPAAATGTAPVAITAPLAGLRSGTTYHYRLVATSGDTTVRGADQSFTTTTVSTLSNLTLETGTLLPVFSSLNRSYSATVPATASEITVTPTAASPTASVAVNGVTVTSGTASAPIALGVGNTPISVVVAAAGNLQTYTVMVTRLPAVFSFATAADVPVTLGDLLATGNSAAFELNFAPSPGTSLTVVRNTGPNPIQGTFSNLVQGQVVGLTFGGTTYRFVATYFGGTGNDLVLQCAGLRLLASGNNTNGQLGNNSVTNEKVLTPVNVAGVLAGKVIIGGATGRTHSLAFGADGTLAAWGDNGFGRLGNNSTVQSTVPVLVDRTGVLAGKTVIGVGAGLNHSVAWCADGTLAAWGQGLYGQLGNNSTANSAVPVLVNRTGVLAGKTVMGISAGSVHNLVWCSDGTLVAWGQNNSGQLGNHSTTSSSVPVAVVNTGVLAARTVVTASAGGDHNLALCSDGTVVAWGRNYYGQLGNNDTNTIGETVPVLVNQTGVLAGRTVVALAAGAAHSLALCADGTLAAWGYNYYGQLGNNSTTDSTVPVLVPKTGALADKTVVGIFAGNNHSMAICADGSLVAWGYNNVGQLGNDGTSQSNVPVAVSAATLHSGEIPALGVLGNLASHQLVLTAMPLPVATGLAASAIGGTDATFNGRVNANNQTVEVTFEYGLDTAYGTTVTAGPASVSGGADTGVRAVVSGLAPGTTYHYRVVATSNGGIVRGGDMTFTTLSDNARLSDIVNRLSNRRPTFDPETYLYLASVDFDQVDLEMRPITEHHGATLVVNGVPVPRGNYSPQFPLAVGNNSLAVVVTAEDGITTLTYTTVVTRLPEFLDLTGGGAPVTASGFSARWRNANLRLGFHPPVGSPLTVVENTSLEPIYDEFENLKHGQRIILPYGGVNYAFVANYFGGTGNDLVLQWADTRLGAWGLNNYGQLGDDSTELRKSPVEIANTGPLADKTLISISTGYLHSLALAADGTLAAWGYNVHGQLGNNGSASSQVPVAVDTAGALAGKTVVAISAGPYHNLALCSDGTVAAWGFNNYGQLGTGDTLTRRTPVIVPPLGALAGKKRVIAIAAGAYHSLALCSDGTLAAWGYNDEGQLGDGSTIRRMIPAAVDHGGALAGKQVALVRTGLYHSLALCTDGTVVAWGYNPRGQIGNGTTTHQLSPVDITRSGALNGRTLIGLAAGGSHSLALDADGQITAWGHNHRGQLGGAAPVQSVTPQLLTGTPPARQISAGSFHNLALATDESLITWGDATNGQLGVAETPPPGVIATPNAALIPDARVISIATGPAASHNLVIIALPVAGARLAQSSITPADDIIAPLLRYAFGLADDASDPLLLPQPQLENGRLVTRFTRPQGVSGIAYGAEWSATLLPGSWQDIPNTGTPDAPEFVSPAAAGPALFMRLKIQME